jgi:hypothetical protein
MTRWPLLSAGLLLAIAFAGDAVSGRSKLTLLHHATLWSEPLAAGEICGVVNVGSSPVTITVRLCDATATCLVPPACSAVVLEATGPLNTRTCQVDLPSGTQAIPPFYCRVQAASAGPIALRGTFTDGSGLESALR